jgi:hypothetical protein
MSRRNCYLDAHRPEDRAFARLASELGEPAVELGAMRLHALHGPARAELQVGVMGGEIHARAGLSGLNDDRAALGRRQGGQWSAHIIVAAAEIDDMDLVRIAEPAGGAIENYGIALDAVP